jgi:hypothetical protein
MIKTTRSVLATVAAAAALTVASVSHAQSSSHPAIDSLDGVWSVTVGFGEIPFLAGSFKPSVSLGYHFSDHVWVGGIVQLSDVLERGTESFNAVNSGLGGLESTHEVTGPRAFLGVRLRPHRYSPYLSLGPVFNGTDRETMRFDARPRNIDGHTTEGSLTVVQSRPYGIRPAFGVGYGYTFDTGVVLNLDLVGAFWMSPPEPDIRVESGREISEPALQAIDRRFSTAFRGNFHNRYHLFNISAGWAW